ncbi:MAG TPA: glycosyltransferase family 1 protein [Deltaproteobacteria bacterium]|nr:glycosyltransferase family 1 protein [Deltaproteobacteria bacterium]
MIYYVCPDTDSPSGGVKKIYNHVDILNSTGISACVLHKSSGFRCRWFNNSTRISCLRKTSLQDTDYVVIPEFYGLLYIHPYKKHPEYRFFDKIFHSPAKKVVFNQGTYLTFNGNSFDKDELINIHTDKDVLATMVVSEDGREFFQYTFPRSVVFRVHNAIDSNTFYYCPAKKRQLCFMPRKNRDHAVNVINMLKFRGALSDFEIVPIDNTTENETVAILQESLIFLSFGYPEGFSLPPAEAMSCGCIVIGYHGMGGKEYFKQDFCFPVETGNIILFTKTVERVLDIYRKDPESLAEMGRKASAHIKENYSTEKEQNDVLRFWNTLLN